MRALSLLRIGMAAATVGLLLGCSNPLRRADALASTAHFNRILIEGRSYHHVAYERPASGLRLLVYVEGDGTPWIDQGRKIATDPTPRRALALELATRTDVAAVLYLGRPCYFGLSAGAECRPSDWTSGRYSPAVVASLATAANHYIREHRIHDVVLIGHSGGGVLAILMAPSVLNLRMVVTIGANLDVQAWTALHGYLPLDGSLDPRDQPPLPSSIAEIHLSGGRDRDVPTALISGYLKTHPQARLWAFPDYDHQCCWANAWPSLLRRVMTQIPDTPVQFQSDSESH
jgi:dienelactone hydrolase